MLSDLPKARAIEADEITAVRAIRKAAAEALTDQFGPGPWSSVQTLETLRKHQAERTVLLIAAGPEAAATFTLSARKPPFYHKDWFANPRAAAVYLSNMAVLPGLQRQGIGRWCMEHAESLAREWGALAVRLDAFQGHAGAGPFYAKCGYELVHAGTLGLEFYEKAVES